MSVTVVFGVVAFVGLFVAWAAVPSLFRKRPRGFQRSVTPNRYPGLPSRLVSSAVYYQTKLRCPWCGCLELRSSAAEACPNEVFGDFLECCGCLEVSSRNDCEPRERGGIQPLEDRL